MQDELVHTGGAVGVKGDVIGAVVGAVVGADLDAAGPGRNRLPPFAEDAVLKPVAEGEGGRGGIDDAGGVEAGAAVAVVVLVVLGNLILAIHNHAQGVPPASSEGIGVGHQEDDRAACRPAGGQAGDGVGRGVTRLIVRVGGRQFEEDVVRRINRAVFGKIEADAEPARRGDADVVHAEGKRRLGAAVQILAADGEGGSLQVGQGDLEEQVLAILGVFAAGAVAVAVHEVAGQVAQVRADDQGVDAHRGLGGEGHSDGRAVAGNIADRAEVAAPRASEADVRRAEGRRVNRLVEAEAPRGHAGRRDGQLGVGRSGREGARRGRWRRGQRAVARIARAVRQLQPAVLVRRPIPQQSGGDSVGLRPHQRLDLGLAEHPVVGAHLVNLAGRVAGAVAGPATEGQRGRAVVRERPGQAGRALRHPIEVESVAAAGKRDRDEDPRAVAGGIERRNGGAGVRIRPPDDLRGGRVGAVKGQDMIREGVVALPRRDRTVGQRAAVAGALKPDPTHPQRDGALLEPIQPAAGRQAGVVVNPVECEGVAGGLQPRPGGVDGVRQRRDARAAQERRQPCRRRVTAVGQCWASIEGVGSGAGNLEGLVVDPIAGVVKLQGAGFVDRDVEDRGDDVSQVVGVGGARVAGGLQINFHRGGGDRDRQGPDVERLFTFGNLAEGVGDKQQEEVAAEVGRQRHCPLARRGSAAGQGGAEADAVAVEIAVHARLIRVVLREEDGVGPGAGRRVGAEIGDGPGDGDRFAGVGGAGRGGLGHLQVAAGGRRGRDGQGHHKEVVGLVGLDHAIPGVEAEDHVPLPGRNLRDGNLPAEGVAVAGRQGRRVAVRKHQFRILGIGVPPPAVQNRILREEDVVLPDGEIEVLHGLGGAGIGRLEAHGHRLPGHRRLRRRAGDKLQVRRHGAELNRKGRADIVALVRFALSVLIVGHDEQPPGPRGQMGRERDVDRALPELVAGQGGADGGTGQPQVRRKIEHRIGREKHPVPPGRCGRAGTAVGNGVADGDPLAERRRRRGRRAGHH
ncbi:MAG: hypothetical protein BWZ02_00875 [Lentisphaerae bacterium ADurb.BinA184]|nr:MAG: hypothetical protein BWZ02_00875 [Lentisphaerae bacterium ADurb.BinA184]